MSIKTSKRILIAFWFEVFLVWLTVMKQATSSYYDKDLDTIVRAPTWSWYTYLNVHVIAFAALLLALAAFLTIKFVHEAEQREIQEKRDEFHKRNKTKR